MEYFVTPCLKHMIGKDCNKCKQHYVMNQITGWTLSRNTYTSGLTFPPQSDRTYLKYEKVYWQPILLSSCLTMRLIRRPRTNASKFIYCERLNSLYSSPSIVRVIESRRMRWAGHVARLEEGRGAHKVLVGKPEGKIPVGRPRRRW